MTNQMTQTIIVDQLSTQLASAKAEAVAAYGTPAWRNKQVAVVELQQIALDYGVAGLCGIKFGNAWD